jgi:Carbohydrate binding domain
VAGSPRESWRRRVGPEHVAAILSAIIVFGGLGVASAIGRSGSGSKPLSEPRASATPVPTPHPFLSKAELALDMITRLAEHRDALDSELASSEFDAAGVVTAVRRISATVSASTGMAATLVQVSGSRDVGQALLEFYASVAKAADATLGISVSDKGGLRAAARRLLATLEPTASLQGQLAELIESARVTLGLATSPPVSASARPATPGPTPVGPTPPPTPEPTTSPSLPTPAPSPPLSASPLPLTGQIANPGFEEGVAGPWTLIVEAPWTATLTIDATEPAFEGTRSARIDIPAASEARSAISLRQPGIEVAQGRRYVCRLALRAASDRDVRVRVASTAGATYGTRLVTVGPTWTVVEFEFGAFVEDPSAVIEIDFGRSAVTGWVDAVQVMDAPG